MLLYVFVFYDALKFTYIVICATEHKGFSLFM